MRVGLLGYPLAHSLSPLIQGIAFERHGLAATYELWETAAEDLEARVRGLREGDCLGANVTVPHKEAVVPCLDRLEATAERTGAVNTIVNRQGSLIGHNTDVEGFARALDRAGFSSAGSRAVVIGAGGVARAVCVALMESGVDGILLTDVVPERADALASRLGVSGRSSVQAAGMESDLVRLAIKDCSLLVNCTPMGMKHSASERDTAIDTALLRPGTLVFDVVYNPPVTPLLAAAEKRGARTAGGLAMLVYQAAASFKLWTGLDAPEDEMLAAGEKALVGES